MTEAVGDSIKGVATILGTDEETTDREPAEGGARPRRVDVELGQQIDKCSRGQGLGAAWPVVTEQSQQQVLRREPDLKAGHVELAELREPCCSFDIHIALCR